MTDHPVSNSPSFNEIGGSIACTIIMLIVIYTSIQVTHTQINYVKSLVSTPWKIDKILITPDYQIDTMKFRDDSMRLSLEQYGREVYTTSCTQKLHSICTSLYNNAIQIQALTFYVQPHLKTSGYTSLHLQDIIFVDQKGQVQTFNYLSTPPNTPKFIAAAKKDVWILLAEIFLAYVLFGSVTFAHHLGRLFKHPQIQKKIGYAVLGVYALSYGYLCIISAITFIKMV